MKCKFDPTKPPYDNAPIGMFHCPECGEMVVANVPHPNYGTESKIYDAVLQELSIFWTENHIPPTIRQLCEKVGVESTSHIVYVLSQAEKKGEVRKVGSKYVPLWVDKLFEKDSS